MKLIIPPLRHKGLVTELYCVIFNVKVTKLSHICSSIRELIDWSMQGLLRGTLSEACDYATFTVYAKYVSYLAMKMIKKMFNSIVKLL